MDPGLQMDLEHLSDRPARKSQVKRPAGRVYGVRVPHIRGIDASRNEMIGPQNQPHSKQRTERVAAGFVGSKRLIGIGVGDPVILVCPAVGGHRINSIHDVQHRHAKTRLQRQRGIQQGPPADRRDMYFPELFHAGIVARVIEALLDILEAPGKGPRKNNFTFWFS